MTFLEIVEHGATKLPPGVALPEGTAVRVDVVGSNGSNEERDSEPTEQNTMHQLPRTAAEQPVSPTEPDGEPKDGYALNRELLKFAGIVDLPADFAINHDHYLYGVP